jgi:peptidoglycan/LPS O-acetylase OafA/YrhL
MTNDPRPQAIDALTGIRGLAAAWVLVFHLRGLLLAFFPGLEAFDGLISSGYLGVDLFFVLSGFVLTYNYKKWFMRFDPTSYLQFVFMRLARIYPVHLVVTAACVGGVLVARRIGANFGNPPEHFTPEDLIRHLMLVHAWGGADPHSWNFPSWSISAEWAAYLMFPALALGLNRVAKHVWFLPLAMVAYAAMLGTIVALYGPTLDLTMEGGLLRISGSFAAGCFGCCWFQANPARSSFADRLALAIGLALIVTCYLSSSPPLWIVYLFGALVLALAKAEGPVSAWLSSPAATYAGRVSYALYMVHALVFLRILPQDYMHLGYAGRAGVVVALVLSAWLSAHLLYVLVEERARKRIRVWVDRFLPRARPVEATGQGVPAEPK